MFIGNKGRLLAKANTSDIMATAADNHIEAGLAANVHAMKTMTWLRPFYLTDKTTGFRIPGMEVLDFRMLFKNSWNK